MNMRDLIPWGRNSNPAPLSYRDDAGRQEQNPFLQLHREMNRLFDDAFRGFNLPYFGGTSSSWGMMSPGVELSENDKEFRITAELPGVEEKDIDIVIDDGVLILRGEKRSETDDKERQFSERYYGRFERRLHLGNDVEEDKVTASFRNGVLTVVLPKSPTARSRARHIAINGAASTKH